MGCFDFAQYKLFFVFLERSGKNTKMGLTKTENIFIKIFIRETIFLSSENSQKMKILMEFLRKIRILRGV